MKNELYILRYAKRHLSAEAMSNSEKKIKPTALAIIELCLSEEVSQPVSRSVGWSVSQVSQSVSHFSRKFH